MPERIPWKESNLALIGSDLDHKIKEAAAGQEPAWSTAKVGQEVGKKVWRIEQFQVKSWPTTQYGEFHTGDSYVVLNSYKRGDSDALYHDVHIWIGAESSQDEYGTAAYKMVECDDFLGGKAVQHREVQGRESPMFQSYFGYNLKYLQGGVASGFTHVEEEQDKPNLYKIKGTHKGLSMTQMPIAKSSLNTGDSFVLFVNASTVWVWHGAEANPDEKAKANSVAESMCTQGTAVVLTQGDGDAEDGAFWGYIGSDGDIAEAEEGDEEVEEFTPLLFKVPADGEEVEQVAKADKIVRFGKTISKLDKNLLDEADVFLLDAGWEVFLWIGKESDKSEKLTGMAKADSYMKEDPRTVDLPLTIVKSGWESAAFLEFFK